MSGEDRGGNPYSLPNRVLRAHYGHGCNILTQKSVRVFNRQPLGVVLRGFLCFGVEKWTDLYSSGK